jgi:hypothetical protein
MLACGALATLVAGALWLRAWRGRVTGWKTCCGRCGFELRGLNPGAIACPECGHALRNATLRPASSAQDPWRWALAISVTALGAAMLWLGQPARLLNSGRQLCAWLPNPLLLVAFEAMPRAAVDEIESRVAERRMDGDAIAEVARCAADMAAASPRERSGVAGRLLSRLSELGSLDPSLTADLLSTCLAGVEPIAGQPKPARLGGLFIVTARLPVLQGTQWIGRRTVHLTIDGAEVRLPDGSARRLDPVAGTESASTREFDGAAFHAPDQIGDFEGTLRIRMQQPGGAFSARASVAFALRVVDPSQIDIQLKPNPTAARAVANWAREAGATCDASGKLVVSLPGDVLPLQQLPVAIAMRALVEQDGLQFEVGHVWVDETSPLIELQAVAMPEALDRSRAATLRLEPDAAWALAKASSSCVVLSEPVRVPLTLPPAPAAPPSATGG